MFWKEVPIQASSHVAQVHYLESTQTLMVTYHKDNKPTAVYLFEGVLPDVLDILPDATSVGSTLRVIVKDLLFNKIEL